MGMINIQKVKKGLGKCWSFFGAKPAQAGMLRTTVNILVGGDKWQCIHCGRVFRSMVSSDNGGDGRPSAGRDCPVTGGGHVWVRIG